jgi:hypothetical protein
MRNKNKITTFLSSILGSFSLISIWCSVINMVVNTALWNIADSLFADVTFIKITLFSVVTGQLGYFLAKRDFHTHDDNYGSLPNKSTSSLAIVSGGYATTINLLFLIVAAVIKTVFG